MAPNIVLQVLQTLKNSNVHFNVEMEIRAAARLQFLSHYLSMSTLSGKRIENFESLFLVPC